MPTGRAVLVICMFLLISSSHLQAARLFPSRNDHRLHDMNMGASPCLQDTQLSALSPPVKEAADMARDGHGRALWSTPSDGVGH